MYAIAAALLALSASIPLASAKNVFAHLIIGNTEPYTANDWTNTINEAKGAGIDGFALNIAKDSWTTQQLSNAYNAAGSSGFKLFLSFDYAAAQSQGGFSASEVVSTIKQYSGMPAQFEYEGKPLVSTFEGTGNAGDWPSIKSQTNAFFVPDYSSLGPQSAAGQPGVDGLLSWDAWPNGAQDMSFSSDQAYISALNGKPYMMPVSPWFYTNLQGKNWMWRGDDLWHTRWDQAIFAGPALVEILTWNDWGESHYISSNPPYQNALPAGSASYVNPTNHSAWLQDLPYYISAYKNGGQATAGSYREHVTFWYRQNPGSACGSSTLCNTATQGQSTLPATQCDVDAVFFTVFSSGTPSVTVSIGGAATTVTASGAGVFHSSVPFNGRTGAVTVTATDGSTKMGPVTGDPITSSCVAGWNAFVASS